MPWRPSLEFLSRLLLQYLILFHNDDHQASRPWTSSHSRVRPFSCFDHSYCMVAGILPCPYSESFRAGRLVCPQCMGELLDGKGNDRTSLLILAPGVLRTVCCLRSHWCLSWHWAACLGHSATNRASHRPEGTSCFPMPFRLLESCGNRSI